jgi:hypothetical protein
MSDYEIAGIKIERKWMSFMMILIAAGMFALAIIMPDPPKDRAVLLGLRAVLTLIGFVTLIFTPRYYVSFREDYVLIITGYLNILKFKIDRNKITHVGLREWSPIKHFGGCGIKGGFGEFRGYQCFNILSGVGIEIKTMKQNYVIEMPDSERRQILALIGNYPRAKSQGSQ